MEQPSDAPNCQSEPMDLDPVHPLAAFDLPTEAEAPIPFLAPPNPALNQHFSASYEVVPECAQLEETTREKPAECAGFAEDISQEIPVNTPLPTNTAPESVPASADLSIPAPSQPSTEPQDISKPPAKPRKSKTNTEEDQSESFHQGQRHPEPSLDDPSRAFYESLLQQNPKSEMAIKYCLEHGLVPESMIDEMMTALTKLKRDAKKKTGV